jgi:hypothetical protein
MPHKPHPTTGPNVHEHTQRDVGYLCLLSWTEVRFVEGETTDHIVGILRLAEAVQPCRPPYELALIDTGTVVAKHIWFVTLSQASYEIHDVILRFFTLLKDKCP